MKSNKGKNISEVEIHTSSFGIWLIVHDTEYFLSYKDYPWFREAKISDTDDVELLHGVHLHWRALDNPEKYSLSYR